MDIARYGGLFYYAMPQIELLRAMMASRYRRAARYYKRVGDLARYEQYAAVARHYGARP